MKKISGAEAIIRCLISEDVDVLFGYPGGAIMPVYDELYKFQNDINLFLLDMNKEQHMQLRVMQDHLERLVLP